MNNLGNKTILVVVGLLIAATSFFIFHDRSQNANMVTSLDQINRQEQDGVIETTMNQDDAYTETSQDSDTPEVPKMIFVDIDGAVNNPGVYSVSDGTRIYSIIEVAGGLTETADTKRINRADFAVDGQKIYIPKINEAVDFQPYMMASVDTVEAQSDKININTASLQELESLNGIGSVLAQRIIDYRATTKFNDIEDIMKVSGIAEGKYLQIKDDITVY